MHVDGGFALIRRWQAYLEASSRVSASTRQQYRRALIVLVADLCIDVTLITEDDVVGWITSHDARGGAVALTLKACHSFYGWAFAREVIVPNPVRALVVPRRKYGRPPALTDHDLVTVLGAARLYRDPRLAPTLELMYATGARIGSIVALTASDVDFERAWVEFRVAKNDDPYGVPMNERAKVALRELLSLSEYRPRHSCTPRRPTLIGVGRSRVMQWIQDIEDVTGIEVHSHLFRHTLLTELAHDPTVPIAVTARLANHKDPRTTMRYVADRESAMARALSGR
jgi:integrase